MSRMDERMKKAHAQHTFDRTYMHRLLNAWKAFFHYYILHQIRYNVCIMFSSTRRFWFFFCICAISCPTWSTELFGGRSIACIITHWERQINNKADLFNFVLFEYNEESKYFDWLNRRPSSWRKSLTRQWMCLFVFFYHVCAHYIGNSWKQNTKNTDRVVLFLVGQSSMWLSNLWYTDIRIRVFLAFSGSKLVQLLNFGMRLSDCLCCVGCARWEWLRHLSCNAKIPHFPFNFRCRAERWLICMHVYGVNVHRCARL